MLTTTQPPGSVFKLRCFLKHYTVVSNPCLEWPSFVVLTDSGKSYWKKYYMDGSRLCNDDVLTDVATQDLIFTFSDFTVTNFKTFQNTVEICYGQDDREVAFRLPTGEQPSPNLWAPPNLLHNEYREFFSQHQSGRGVSLSIQRNLMPRWIKFIPVPPFFKYLYDVILTETHKCFYL